MKTLIQDICDVTLLRLSDNKVIFIGEAQLSSISQKIDTQDIRGGFGSKLICITRSGKNIDLTVRNAVWDSDYLEIVSGIIYNSETNTIFKKEENLLYSELLVEDSEIIDDTYQLDDTYQFNDIDGLELLLNYLFNITIANKVIITGTPKTGGNIKVIATDGTQYDGIFHYGTIIFSGGIDGAYYICIYELDVTGNTIKIQADKFPEKFYVEYKTIEYSLIDNIVLNDIYFTFNNVLPDGNFDLSFEMGKAISPEMKFTALKQPNSNVIGKILEIPRN